MSRKKPSTKQKPPVPAPVPETPTKSADDDLLLSGLATKLSASAGIVVAMVLATFVNVYVARHYKRWDWTRGGLYTLSEATQATLHDLGEPVKITVLLPSGEPLTLSVQHLLDAYRGESDRLSIEYLDPDRRPADFFELAQRYGISAEKDEGRTIAGAAALVTRGDRREIVRHQDLVELDAEDDLKRRPRLEQAFTSALRSVTSTDRPRACFTTGHGEPPVPALAEHLARSGFEVASVEHGDRKALDGCKVLVIGGPSERVPAEDASAYKAYLEKGGSAFVALGKRPENAERGFSDEGLGDVLGAYGLALDADMVFEADPRLRSPRGRGETFAALPRSHPSTIGLLRVAERGVAPVLTVVSSISATGAGSAAVTPLLDTSDQSFGMVDFATWAASGGPALPSANDKKGPLHVAYAAEKSGAPGGPHQGRMIVVGSVGVLETANWQSEELRGTAMFVEGSLAWLSSRPPILDIPQKPAFTAGLHVSDEWLASTFRYVVLYMPFAAMLIGFAVHLRRRGEKRPEQKP